MHPWNWLIYARLLLVGFAIISTIVLCRVSVLDENKLYLRDDTQKKRNRLNDIQGTKGDDDTMKCFAAFLIL